MIANKDRHRRTTLQSADTNIQIHTYENTRVIFELLPSINLIQKPVQGSNRAVVQLLSAHRQTAVSSEYGQSMFRDFHIQLFIGYVGSFNMCQK